MAASAVIQTVFTAKDGTRKASVKLPWGEVVNDITVRNGDLSEGDRVPMERIGFRWQVAQSGEGG